MSLLVVTGLLAEAEIAAGPGVRTLAGGGDVGLDRRLEAEIARWRPEGVLSFGVAGALDPALRVGDVVSASAVVGEGWKVSTASAWSAALTGAASARPAPVAALPVPAASAAMKRGLRNVTGAAAVDMESGAVALAAQAAGLPFTVLRVISDAAGDTLPPAALAGMRPDGRTDAAAVLASLLRRPQQLTPLIRTARDFGRAMARLKVVRAASGAEFAFSPERGEAPPERAA